MFSKTKIFWKNIKVELGLPNYATKADLKNATGVDWSNLLKGWFSKLKI